MDDHTGRDKLTLVGQPTERERRPDFEDVQIDDVSWSLPGCHGAIGRIRVKGWLLAVLLGCLIVCLTFGVVVLGADVPTWLKAAVVLAALTGAMTLGIITLRKVKSNEQPRPTETEGDRQGPRRPSESRHASADEETSREVAGRHRRRLHGHRDPRHDRSL